jgi:hypothetical protein
MSATSNTAAVRARPAAAVRYSADDQSIAPAASRKSIQQAAAAAAAAATATPSIRQAEQLKTLENHFDRIIKRWINAKATDPSAKEASVSVPLMALAGSSMPALWREQYQSAGYVVTMDARKFTVSLP